MKIMKLDGTLLLEIQAETLSRAYLSRAYLSGADLSRAYLSGADLSRADLSEADLSRAYLSGADLSRADLSGANLSGADLSRADLSGANLSGANLSGANLSGAYLSRVKGILQIGPMRTSGRMIYAVKHESCIMVQAGCFWGTLEQLHEKVLQRHNCAMYIQAINLIKIAL